MITAPRIPRHESPSPILAKTQRLTPHYSTLKATTVRRVGRAGRRRMRGRRGAPAGNPSVRRPKGRRELTIGKRLKDRRRHARRVHRTVTHEVQDVGQTVSALPVYPHKERAGASCAPRDAWPPVKARRCHRREALGRSCLGLHQRRGRRGTQHLWRDQPVRGQAPRTRGARTHGRKPRLACLRRLLHILSRRCVLLLLSHASAEACSCPLSLCSRRGPALAVSSAQQGEPIYFTQR